MKRGPGAAGPSGVIGRTRNFQEPPFDPEEERHGVELIEGRSVYRAEVHARVDAEIDVEPEPLERPRRGDAEAVAAGLVNARRESEPLGDRRSKTLDFRKLQSGVQVAAKTVPRAHGLGERRVDPRMQM